MDGICIKEIKLFMRHPDMPHGAIVWSVPCESMLMIWLQVITISKMWNHFSTFSVHVHTFKASAVSWCYKCAEYGTFDIIKYIKLPPICCLPQSSSLLWYCWCLLYVMQATLNLTYCHVDIKNWCSELWRSRACMVFLWSTHVGTMCHVQFLSKKVKDQGHTCYS